MAQIKIHRDGSVETLCGTQDIGGGARTVVLLHTSRYLKYLPLDRITVKIGDSGFGASGASAGSSTTRSVEWEIRRAVESLLKNFFEGIAGKLKVDAKDLTLEEGGLIRYGEKKVMPWKEACGLLRDSVMSYVPTAVDPDAQWALVRDDGRIDQATEENYRA